MLIQRFLIRQENSTPWNESEQQVWPELVRNLERLDRLHLSTTEKTKRQELHDVCEQWKPSTASTMSWPWPALKEWVKQTRAPPPSIVSASVLFRPPASSQHQTSTSFAINKQDTSNAIDRKNHLSELVYSCQSCHTPQNLTHGSLFPCKRLGCVGTWQVASNEFQCQSCRKIFLGGPPPLSFSVSSVSDQCAHSICRRRALNLEHQHIWSCNICQRLCTTLPSVMVRDVPICCPQSEWKLIHHSGGEPNAAKRPTCLVCFKMFEADASNSPSFCSAACSMSWDVGFKHTSSETAMNRKKVMGGKCLTCHKTFVKDQPPYDDYCNTKCRRKAVRMDLGLESSSASIPPPPSFTGGRSSTSSIEPNYWVDGVQATHSQFQQHSQALYPSIHPDTEKCRHCGKRFVPSTIKQYDFGSYCCNDCLQASKQKLTCMQCKKQFVRSSSSYAEYCRELCRTIHRAPIGSAASSTK
jgi:hypothetical protein